MTPEETAAAAERAIVAYAQELSLSTPEDARRALEMLISKAARGIEKECGVVAALSALCRTEYHLAANPMDRKVQ